MSGDKLASGTVSGDKQGSLSGSRTSIKAQKESGSQTVQDDEESGSGSFKFATDSEDTQSGEGNGSFKLFESSESFKSESLNESEKLEQSEQEPSAESGSRTPPSPKQPEKEFKIGEDSGSHKSDEEESGSFRIDAESDSE